MILESLDYTIKQLEQYNRRLKSIKVNRDLKKDELTKVLKELEDYKKSKEYYSLAVDQLYQESIGALTNYINYALRKIIYDEHYEVELNLKDSGGTKLLNIFVLDKTNDCRVDIKDGVGQGVRTIISFVLKLYSLLNKDSRVLILDEKYSYLSASYVPLFFEFIKETCEKEDFILVMITHDERFMSYADKTYRVNKGTIIEVK